VGVPQARRPPLRAVPRSAPAGACPAGVDDPRETLLRRAAGLPGVVSFAGGLPADAQFPRRALTAAFVAAVAQPAASALQYGWPEGEAALREWVAARLRARGAQVAADEVLVTSGAQQAIAIAAGLVCRPGGAVLVEPESYAAALDLFRGRGLRPTTSAAGACAAYVMPALSNPRGWALGGGARAALIASGLPLIEDDAYAELRFAGPPPRPLVADVRARTLHVGTFSKTVSPGLRVGWLVVPPRLQARALRAKRDADLQANSLAQAILAGFLRREDFDARLRRLRRYYRRKADRLAASLRRRLPSWRFRDPEGGFSIWVETDVALSEIHLLAHAVEAGVCYDPGSLFRADGRTVPLALRLSFSAVAEDAVDRGVARLARAWRAVAREPAPLRLTGRSA
jgi:2-aminoadipate transaminase